MDHGAQLARPRTTVVTSRQARQDGISRASLNAMNLRRVMQGIYIRDHPATENMHPAERLRDEHVAVAIALHERLGPERFYSHETAAALWGLPVNITQRTPIYVGVTHRSARLSGKGYRCPVLKAELAEITRMSSLQLTSPTATWAMLAPHLPRSEAVALGDAVIRVPRIGGTQRLERSPLASLEQLAATIDTPHRRGRTTLRTLLPVLSPHSASVPETHLRLLLIEAGLSPEALDFDVCGVDGRWVGTSEIAYPTRKVAVEYEGEQHRTTTRQWNRDIEKYSAYTALGWRTVRVTAQMLYRTPQRLCDYIRDMLRKPA